MSISKMWKEAIAARCARDPKYKKKWDKAVGGPVAKLIHEGFLLQKAKENGIKEEIAIRETRVKELVKEYEIFCEQIDSGDNMTTKVNDSSQFKVGDKVKIINNAYGGYAFGDVTEITDLDINPEHVWVRGTEEYPNGVCFVISNLIKYDESEETISTPLVFEVGDIVEIFGDRGTITNKNSLGNLEITIKGVERNHYVIVTPEGKIYSFQKEPCVKLIERPVKEQKFTLKVDTEIKNIDFSKFLHKEVEVTIKVKE